MCATSRRYEYSRRTGVNGLRTAHQYNKDSVALNACQTEPCKGEAIENEDYYREKIKTVSSDRYTECRVYVSYLEPRCIHPFDRDNRRTCVSDPEVGFLYNVTEQS